MASVLDLVIEGGTVVTGGNAVRADVGVADGRVALIAEPGALPGDAARRIDATGRFVVPGGIDAHVHFNIKVTEAMSAQSATDGSRAAAYGGTTTFIDFAFQGGDESPVEAIRSKIDELNGQRPHVDYALHLMLTGDLSFAAMDEIPEAVSGGVSSFKMFTTFAAGSASGDLLSDDGRIWGVMERTARAGGLVQVHCEDDCIIDYHVRGLYRDGEAGAPNIHRARPPLAEEAAIRRMILLSERSGCPLYVVHVSSTLGTEAIRQAKTRRLPVTGEVLHNYLAFTSDNYALTDGLIYHNYPPLKSKADQATLWAAIADGGLDTVASDDFTIPKAAKLSGPMVDNAPGGHNGVETRMNVLFSEGVARGRLTIERYVELSAENPARLFGIYPRKGAIAVGSDADIIVIDPAVRETIRLDQLHSDCDYSVWEGWELEGKVTTTILRGEVLVQDGEWVGEDGRGQYVPSGSPLMPR
ncbi:MAG TPA: amidohydrolase family protein [Candidatus Limnocylindrales bacterium]|nr:amidohydrolase family protein [Candidatus Limnocylindrales bacterium]